MTGNDAGQPAREPGNAWVRPEAERPPRRHEGTVSDPDQYPQEPPRSEPGRLRPAGAGTVSDPDA
jgi:hypothetical protein